MKAARTGFNPDYSEPAPGIEELEALAGAAVLEFGAPWCGYCLAAGPHIRDALSGSGIPHIKVYDGKGKRLGRAWRVKLWPTLIFLKDGQEVARVVRPRDTAEVANALSKIR